MSSITYSYIKKRRDFGAQPMYCEVPSHMVDSIEPNLALQKLYGLRNPVHELSQATLMQSECYINTPGKIFKDALVDHSEGGWPKEVNCQDEEHTARFRRRVERDDNYIDAILNLYPSFAHFISQNNGIDFYEMYYTTMPRENPVEKNVIRIKNVIPDKYQRPISCIDWTLEDNPKLVVAYCDREFPALRPKNKRKTCYFWDIENSDNPVQSFVPPSALWQVACTPAHPAIVLGGLDDGRCCAFDVRVQEEPVQICPVHLAHREPINSLLFLASRLNNEFFTGSSDGSVRFWDVRNLSEPTEILVMAVRLGIGQEANMTNSQAVSCLQYERQIPTKFLCGTDTGLVINVNRKGKTPSEIFSVIMDTQVGQVKTLQRCPSTTKIFLSCGDWSINLWSDDVRTQPILTGTKQRYVTNDIAWSPTRVSSYMAVSNDGMFRYYDLLRSFKEPAEKLQISRDPVLKLKPNEEGQFVACGDSKGSIILILLSESMVQSAPNDKTILNQIFDREGVREHLLELRVKEIRLKAMKGDEEEKKEDVPDIEGMVKNAEVEYKKLVSETIKALGIPPPQPMKKKGKEKEKGKKKK